MVMPRRLSSPGTCVPGLKSTLVAEEGFGTAPNVKGGCSMRPPARDYGTPTAARTSLSTTDGSIYFSEELLMLRDSIRRHIREEVVPVGEEWEKQGQIPRSEFRRLGELGFLGLAHGEAVGGAGLGVLASVILAEELGRSTHGGLGISVTVHTDMATPHLVNSGTPEQIAKYMPGILAGELITSLAVTEP